MSKQALRSRHGVSGFSTSRRQSRRRFNTAVLSAVAASNLVAALTVQGVTRTWIGPTSGSNWETTTNWTGTAVPASGDLALFNGNDQSGGVSPLSFNITAFQFGNGEIVSVGSLQTSALGIVLNAGPNGANTAALRLSGFSVAAGAGSVSFTSSIPGGGTTTQIGTIALGAGSLTPVWTNNSSNTVSFTPDLRLAMGGALGNYNLTLAGTGNWDWGMSFINPGCSISFNGANPTSTLTFSSPTIWGPTTGSTTSAGNVNAVIVRNGTVVIAPTGAVLSKNQVDIGAGTLGAGEKGNLVVQGAGSLTASSALSLGVTSDAAGTLTVQDTALVSVGTAGLFVGSANAASSTGSGNVNISGGTITVNATGDGSFVVGGRNAATSGGAGTINLSGGQINAAGNVWVGGFGSGTINQTGGIFNAANYISLGRQAGSKGTWNLSGGSVSFSGGAASMTVGEGGAGTLNMTTGTLQLPAGMRVGSAAGSSGNVTIGGNATLITPGIFGGAGQSIVNFNGGTLLATATASTNFVTATAATVGTFGAVIDTAGKQLVISSPMLHNPAAPAVDGGLTLYSGGNVTLSGSTSFTGPINVNGGTLNLGNASHAPVAALNLASGASLGLVNNAVDTLLTNGAIAFTGSTLSLEVGTAAGDQISTTGAATVSGTNTINLSLVPGQSISSGSFSVIHASGGGLVPADFSLGTKPPGFYTANLSSSTANDIVLNIVSNPAPAVAYWTGKASAIVGGSNWAAAASNATVSNWSTDAAGTTDAVQVPGGASDVVFTAANATGSGGALTTTLDATYSVKGLTYDVPASTGITSTSINPNGSSLIIGADGMTMAATSASSGNITGSGSVILNGSQAWTNNSSTQVLSVSRPVGALSGPTTLTVGGTGSVTINGPLTDGAGTVSLVVSNPATTIGGVSTYTGNTTIGSGAVLDVVSTGKISSNTTVQTGGTLRLTAGTDVFGDNNSITLQDGGTLDVRDAAGVSKSESIGSLLGTGVVTRSTSGVSTLLVGGNGSTTYGGVVQNGSGVMNFGKVGGGTLTLAGTNTYTGATIVGGGVLIATEGVGIPANSNLAMNGGLLVANNSITRTIGSTDTGTGKLSSTGSTGFITDASDLTITLLNGGSPIPWGSGVFNAGTIVFNSATSTHNITFNADLQMDNTSRGIVVNAGTVTWNGASSGGAGGTLTLNASGNAPGGTLVMPHNNSSYSGEFDVSVVGNQVIQVLATDALGTGTLGLNDGGAAKTTQVQLIGGASGISLDNSVIFTQQRDSGVPFLENISGNNTVTGTIQLGFGGGTSIIRGDAGLLTLTGTIQQASTAGISPRNLTLMGDGVAAGSIGGPVGAAQSSLSVTKSGTGTWVLKGTNGYTGSTTLTSGTLTADASSNTAFGIGTVTVNGGTLNLNGSNAIAGAGTGALIVSSGWVNATVANATASAATVTLNGGTTVLRDPQAFGGGSIVVGNNIQNINPVLDLQTDGGDKAYDISMSSFDGLTVTLSRATPGATVTHNLGRLIPGIFTTFTFVSGTNVTGAAPIVSVAGINITSSSALTGASVINPINAVMSVGTVGTSNSGFSRTLELSGSSTGNAITGTIFEGNNSLGITKSGTGSWVLSGTDNFYSGVTTVRAGTLEMTPSTQLPIFSNAIGADVQGGRLVLDYSGSSIAAQVRDTIHGGHIVDTVATAGVGVAYFDDGTSAVTLRPDLFGDANDDNKVNALDFNALATNYGTGQFWQQGDFNYDAVVDSNDFVLLAQNFNSTLPVAAPVLGTLVPEPIGIALLAAPLVGLRRRRRDRQTLTVR